MKISYDTIENKMINILGERDFRSKFAKKIKEYKIKEVLSLEHYLNHILSGMDDSSDMDDSSNMGYFSGMDDFSEIQFIKLGAEMKDQYLESMLIPATFDRSPDGILRKAYMTQAKAVLSYISINLEFNTLTFQGCLSGLYNESGSNDSLTLEITKTKMNA